MSVLSLLNKRSVGLVSRYLPPHGLFSPIWTGDQVADWGSWYLTPHSPYPKQEIKQLIEDHGISLHILPILNRRSSSSLRIMESHFTCLYGLFSPYPKQEIKQLTEDHGISLSTCLYGLFSPYSKQEIKQLTEDQSISLHMPLWSVLSIS